MQIRIILTQFWRDLRAQRLRTGLTLFGLAWGTFCVVVLLSFGEGMQRKQYETMAGMGERIILIWGSRTSLPHEGLPRGRYIRLEDSDADAIARQVQGVVEVCPEYSDQVVLKGPKGEPSAGLAGVRPCFGAMRRVEAAEGGRFLNERDQVERRRVVFLGDRVKKDLFGEEEAVGRTIEVRGIPFTVIGAMPHKEQESNYNGRDDNKVFIPSSVAIASLGHRYPDNLVVEIDKTADGKEVMKRINQVMGRIHHYDTEDQEALMSWDVGEMLKMFMTIFIGFKTFLAILGVFTLAVAGIGVSNIMSMVVEDRTSQIGIAMAVGARRRWVLSQVLLETLLIIAVGGGIGVLLASGVVSACRFLPLKDSLGAPVFSWQIASLTAGILGLIGLLSGMGPARRAAGLSPAIALRS
jgi:putative ABC transport system permease protein